MTDAALADDLLTLFNLYAPGDGFVVIDARSQGGARTWQAVLPTEEGVHAVPVALRTILAELDFAFTIVASAYDLARKRPLRLPWAFAVFDLPLVFTEDANRSWQWRPSAERVRDVAAALGGFAIPPGIVIDACSSLVACWVFDVPIPADDHARALLERMAARFGGPLFDGDPCAAKLPLPGGIVRNAGAIAPIVSFARFAPDERVTVAALEAALAAEPELPRSAPPDARRRAGARA